MAPVSLVRIALASALLLALVLVPFMLFGDLFDGAAAQAASQGRGSRIAAAGMVLLALDIFLPVPSSVVATAMGAALGASLGTLVNTAGLTAGCLAGLLVGRSGAGLAQALLGTGNYRAFVRWIDVYGIAAVLICRPVPVLAEASIIALGAGRAKLWRTAAAAALADICLGAAYAFAGAASGPAAAPAAPAFAAAIGLPAIAGIVAILLIRRGRERLPAEPR